MDPVTAEANLWETFERQTLGRRLRSIARFAHTGEYFGITGQTIAGVGGNCPSRLDWARGRRATACRLAQTSRSRGRCGRADKRRMIDGNNGVILLPCNREVRSLEMA
jgi:hypothetical protein